MNTFKEDLDFVLTKTSDVSKVISILGITKNELFDELQHIEGGYSTAGIASDHGTITKNSDYDKE